MTMFSVAKGMLPYLLVCVLAFVGLPLLCQDEVYLIVLLLILFPAVCFVTGVVYGFFVGFHPVFPLLTVLLFLPTVSFYTVSAAVASAFVILFVSLVGSAAGWFARRSRS